MTAPVHSLKHAKAEFQRYHLLAIASALLTLVTIVLAAVASSQVAHLGSERAQAISAAQYRAHETPQCEAAAFEERLGLEAMEQQLTAEQPMVQRLASKDSILQKQGIGLKSAGNEIPQQPLPMTPLMGRSSPVGGPDLPTAAP